MEIPDGINDLSVMNFVDGYSFGPHAIFGYMSPSRQRFEVEETVRWAVSREAWLAKGALRWYSPVERAVMVELHGGRHTEDYDHDPTMPMSQSLLATGIVCAWLFPSVTTLTLRCTLPGNVVARWRIIS